VRRLPGTETLLVLACAGGAAMLGVSQFTDLFHLTPPGGEALKAIDATDQHGYATLVLAIFALILIVVTIAARGQPLAQIAAVAVAVCGLVALLIFLIGDLPDVNRVGSLADQQQFLVESKAEPQAGFWLELVGSLVLTVCGAALATLKPAEEEPPDTHGGRSHETPAGDETARSASFEWRERQRG
jgi:hypothetical protein